MPLNNGKSSRLVRNITFLVDDACHEFEKIITVMNNLKTHTTGSLYKAFKPDKTRRMARKPEVQCTLKRGSWHDIAETLINIMTQKCLNRRSQALMTLGPNLKNG